MKNVLKYAFACALLTAGVLVTVSAENFDCDNYNPNICTLDAIMFCLTNGTIIVGRCHAQRAVCVEGKTSDPTFAACSQSNDRFNCEKYNANPMVCTRDLIPFCLNNGTVVRGSCRAQQAVCKENKQVVDDFSTCNRAAVANNQQTGDNSATAVSATVSLLLGLLLAVLF